MSAIAGLRGVLAGLGGARIDTLAQAVQGGHPSAYLHCVGLHLERSEDPVQRYGAHRALSAVHGGVEVTTGHKRLSATDEVDLALPGRLPLVFARGYSSRIERVGLLGRGWHTPWEVSLQRRGDQLVYLDANGRPIPLPMPAPGTQVIVASEQVYVACLPDGRMVVTDLAPRYAVFGEFDAAGIARLKYIENLQQQRVGFIWGPAGELRRVRGLCGHELRLHYRETPVGLRLASIEGIDGGMLGTLASYGYDAGGMLTEVRNRAGDTTRRFAYRNGLMVEEVNALGAGTRYDWITVDGRPRVAERRTSEGAHDRFAYDVAGRQHRVANADGDAAHWFVDALDRVVAHTDFDGRHYRFEFNLLDCPTALHLPGNRVVRLEYDVYGRLTKETDPLGQTTSTVYEVGTCAPVMTQLDDGRYWMRQYDATGALISCRDPAGGVERIAYGEDGLPAVITAADGTRSTLAHNRWGQVTCRVEAGGQETRYDYDAEGRLVSVTDAAGGVARLEYNTASGKPQTLIRPDGWHERFAWNALGQLTGHTDADGHERQWHRDQRGRVVRFTDAEGHVTRYAYDKHGDLEEVVNPNGVPARFERDATGRLRTAFQADGMRRVFEYNDAGEVSRIHEHAKGDVRQQILRRDALGRVVARETEHAHHTYVYDRLGQCISVMRKPTEPGERLGVIADTLRFDYDEIGRLTAEHGVHGTVRYPAGTAGTVAAITLPDGQRVESIYDENRNVRQLRFADMPVVEMRYDALRREVARSQGTLATYTGYDPLGLMVWQRAVPIANATQPDGLERDRSVLWADLLYSGNGRLLSMQDGVAGITHYDYDRNGRLLRRVARDLDLEYFSWDPAGNPIDRQRHTADWQAAICMDNKPCAYNAMRYEYDAWGRVARKSSRNGEIAFEWDADSQLLAVHLAGQVVRYDYDAVGRRIAKRVELHRSGHLLELPQAVETRFVWCGATLAQERSGQQVRTYLYRPVRGWASHVPLAFADQTMNQAGLSQPALRYYHVDSVGAAFAVTGHDGKLLWSVCYKAWGNTTARAGTSAQVKQPMRFAGQYRDAESGLHYSLLRYYDPDFSRYLSPFVGPAPSPYAYAPNALAWVNPLGGASEPVVAFPGTLLRPIGHAFDWCKEVGGFATRSQDIPLWNIPEFGEEH